MPLRLPLLVWLILAPLLRAAGPELTVGTAHAGRIMPGAPATFWLSAKEQDYVSVAVHLAGTTGTAQILDEAGATLRVRQIDGDGQIGFVAPVAGKFTVKLLAAKACDYAARLNPMLTVEARTKPPEAGVPSPRLRALRDALEAGEPGAVPRFWEELKARGSPLIEPIEHDAKRMLVTFVWRGSQDTRNVSVLWESFSRMFPDKAVLTRLSGTDVWFTSASITKTKRFYYKFVENGPLPPRPDDSDARARTAIRQGIAQGDPFNPRQFDDTPNPGSDYYGAASFVEMPDAPAEPWIQPRPDVARGRVDSRSFASVILGNERTITVYTPPHYADSGQPYGVIFLTDGDSYIRGQFVLEVLNNLIAARQIPPLVAVMIGNAPGARTRELSGDAKFEEFLVSEIIPWAQRSYHITREPRRTIIGGLSLGGLTAAYMGWRHPDIFGNVLAQSGSFWWMPPRDPTRPAERDYDAEPNWLSSQFLTGPKLPLRFYLSSGLDELDMRGKGASILVPNRHLRDVLRAKEYDIAYEEVDGAHDSLNWRYTFPRGLIALAKEF